MEHSRPGSSQEGNGVRPRRWRAWCVTGPGERGEEPCWRPGGVTPGRSRGLCCGQEPGARLGTLLSAGVWAQRLPCPAAASAIFPPLGWPSRSSQKFWENCGSPAEIGVGLGSGCPPSNLSSCSALWVLMTQPVMYVNICNACKCTHTCWSPASQPLSTCCLLITWWPCAPSPRADPTPMCPKAVRVGTLGTDGEEAAQRGTGPCPRAHSIGPEPGCSVAVLNWDPDSQGTLPKAAQRWKQLLWG